MQYNQNKFVLVREKFLDDMEFQGSVTVGEVKEIAFYQAKRFLQGLEIERKKIRQQVKSNLKDVAFYLL